MDDRAKDSVVATLRTGARRVVHRVRATRRSDAGELRGPDEPALLFRPRTGQWYVALGGRWHPPASDADVDALLCELPVEVIDERVLSTEGSRGGKVRVADDGGEPMLEFLASVGELATRVRLPRPGRATAEWVTGAHPDGWIETTATLRLDGVRRLYIDGYLPAMDDGAAKELAVQASSGTRTTIDVHRLSRGATTRIAVFSSPVPARSMLLTLHCAYPEPVDDERALGFVATGLEAHR